MDKKQAREEALTTVHANPDRSLNEVSCGDGPEPAHGSQGDAETRAGGSRRRVSPALPRTSG